MMAKAKSSQETGNALATFASVIKRESNQKLLTAALTHGLDKSRFIRCAWILVQSDERLNELAVARPAQVFRAMLQCAQMGLYPDGINGDAYLIVYGKDINTATCSATRGYRGLIRLFSENNSDAASGMPVIFDDVRDGDEFVYERGSSPMLSHKPMTTPGREEKAITHYYAAAVFKDGKIWPKVMTAAEVEEFRTYAASSKFWDSNHPNTRRWMRLKVVIKQLFKEVPIPFAVREQLDQEDEGNGDLDKTIGDILDITAEETHIAGDMVKTSQPKQDSKEQKSKERRDPALTDTIVKVITAFSKYKVTQKMLENRFGLVVEDWTEKIIDELQGLYRELKEGAARDDLFPPIQDTNQPIDKKKSFFGDA